MIRVLCLDIEGGYGGSSRSLFESVRHLGRDKISAEVWCRRQGPIQPRYAELGVPCRVTPDMPHVSSLPRLSRNLYAYGRAAIRMPRSATFRRELAAALDERFDVVHFNHEGLFLLARWLRPRARVPFTMHIRTNLVNTPFARWQTRTIARAIDHLVFITENERENFERLGGRPQHATVIYNSVELTNGLVSPHPEIPQDGRFKVACMGNYAWERGQDRLVSIARSLARVGRRDVVFVVAGNMRLPRSLPGELGAAARAGGTLVDYVQRSGVGEMFHFLGHVSEPERVFAASDLSVRPSRGDDPWGRDVLETLAAGRPIVAAGTYDRFIEDGITGVLRPAFDADSFARAIIDLADDRARCAALGRAGRERVRELCNGPARSAELLNLWQDVARA